MSDLLHYVNFEGKADYYTRALNLSGRACDSTSMRFRLLKFRNERGYTQAQLAGMLGISQGLCNQLESGKRRMNETYLAQLAEIYGVHPTELIVDPARDDPLYQELERAFRSLSPTERKILVNSAKGIIAARAEPERQ